MSDNQKVTINDQSYALTDLNENARKQIMNLRLVDRRIEQLQQDLAIARTARSVFAQTLLANLPAATKPARGKK